MKELAEIAHVSVSTVSKAFCDADDISAATKEQIFALARQYGCYGKFYKGKYHKRIIAVICPELAGNFYTSYLLRLQKVIEESGGICIISADDFEPRKQAELIEYYASYLKVDGLFVFDLREPLKKGYAIPVVALFHSNDPTVDSVNLNFAPAVYEAAGIDGIKQLTAQNKPFTALICAYDHIAFGAIRQSKKQGLRVPDDVSVIGMDNISLAAFSATSLHH